MKQTYRYEDDLQKAVAQYLDAKKYIWFHPANERKTKTLTDKKGRRYSPEGNKLKQLGVKPGLPDVIILDPQVVIELKIGRNKTTYMQKLWLEKFRKLGWEAHVCRSLDEVIEVLE